LTNTYKVTEHIIIYKLSTMSRYRASAYHCLLLHTRCLHRHAVTCSLHRLVWSQHDTSLADLRVERIRHLTSHLERIRRLTSHLQHFRRLTSHLPSHFRRLTSHLPSHSRPFYFIFILRSAFEWIQLSEFVLVFHSESAL